MTHLPKKQTDEGTVRRRVRPRPLFFRPIETGWAIQRGGRGFDAHRMSAPIYLPARMVVTPGGLPDICPRHGRIAVRQRKVTFASRPPLWAYLFLFLGFVPLLIVALVVRKTLTAPNWSFCDECLARRRSRLIAMGVTAAVMALSLLSARLPVVPVLGIGIGIVVLVVLGFSRGWVAIAAADVTRDGQALIVRKPAPGYVNHLPPPPGGVAPQHGSVPPQFGSTPAPRAF